VDELAQFGASHVRFVHSVTEVVVDLALAKTMGCEGGTRWLQISSLRMDGGKKLRPICWTNVYMDPSYADIADIADIVRASPQALISALIETQHGRRIACIQQDFNAVSLSPSRLKVEVNSPALQLVRRYLDANDFAFEISVTTHPADRFTFSMQMDRSREQVA
jgi:GntR family transcriptional regulator